MTDHNHSFPQALGDKHFLFRQHLIEMAGEEDIRGMEISGLIRMLANCYDSAINQNDEFSDISSSRMGILMRLLGEKQFGNQEGINPTQISRARNVSKNTISALLRGLEEQGLVERNLDPSDRRRFLIRITPAGEELIRTTAPDRVRFMNQLSEGLNDEEKKQLLALLTKLRQSILRGCGNSTTNNDADISLHHNLSVKE